MNTLLLPFGPSKRISSERSDLLFHQAFGMRTRTCQREASTSGSRLFSRSNAACQEQNSDQFASEGLLKFPWVPSSRRPVHARLDGRRSSCSDGSQQLLQF